MPAPADPRQPTGAVLAGGSSRRMGTDKATLPLGATTMLDRVVARLRPHAREVVIVGGPAVPGLRHLDDRRPGAGPLAGIEAALASGLDDAWLVCPCDLPFVTDALLAPLADADDAPATVLRVAGEDAPRPLPARLTTAALPVVRRRLDAGRRSVRGLVAALPARVVEVPAAAAAALANVNTPEDLAEAARRLDAAD
ncbi:MAG: molybdenum cofactor guanylyltransferase [Planctomycetota bacterium]|jgi:molybdopterin-guanine dinucleotide biosynthesis protein A